MRQIKKFIILGGTLAILSGCATMEQAETAPPVEPTTVAKPDPAPAEEPVYGSFEPETLYALLVAELAGQRERYDILLSSYLHQAQKTRDPGLAERATRIATYLKANQAALSAADLWAEVAPNSVKAKQALAVQLIKARKFEQAVELLEVILEANGDANFEYLAINTKDLNQSDRSEILKQFNRLLESRPDNTRLLFGKTILLQLGGRVQEALSTAGQLHTLQQDTQSLLLQAKLLHQLGKTKKALSSLNKELKQDPDNRQVRLLYAQILIDSKMLTKAQEQFNLLVESNPEDGQLRLTLALIALENSYHSEAKHHLSQLLTDDKLSEDAHYYLAQVAETEQQPKLAIQHYQKVLRSDKSVSAHSRIGHLLLQQKQLIELQQIFLQSRLTVPKKAKTLFMLEADLLTKYSYAESALVLLNVALTEHPDDINLLYSRALTSERLNDLAAMERDMRRILGLQPDNATVLNALGYTLADRTDRYHEAMELISRANELKPNDPAITDSLGWALFRLGKYEESIKLLEKAFADFPDHEVAAHLGEVLWMSGQYERARKIWTDALEKKPDSEILKRVVERLNPEQLQ